MLMGRLRARSTRVRLTRKRWTQASGKIDNGGWTKRRRRDVTAVGDAGQVYQASAELPPSPAQASSPRSSPKRRRGSEKPKMEQNRSVETSGGEATDKDELWATREVTLLAKIPTALMVEDFRPIAVLQVMFKLYSRVLYMLAGTTCKSRVEPPIRLYKIPPSTRGGLRP